MSPNFQFRLDFSVVLSSLQNRLKDGLFSDLLIRTSEGIEFQGHKLILGSVSPMVKSALQDLTEENQVVIILPDFDHASLNSILPVLYGKPNLTGNIIPDPDLLECLCIDSRHQTHSQDVYILEDDSLETESFDQNELTLNFDSQTEVQAETFVCANCDKSLSNADDFELHFEQCSKTKVDEEQKVRKGRKRKPRRVEEPKCSNSLENNKSDLISTKKQKLPSKSDFHCNKCSENFKDLNSYNRHVRSQHKNVAEKIFQCNQCSKCFSFEKVLSNHMLTHQKPAQTKLICDKCSKTFNNKSTYHYHIQKHKNPSHQCTMCPRVFKSARGLGYHISAHNGITDFLCHDCGKGFVTRQKLINHRRSKHTFEKPYICDQCGQGFVRSDKLMVHKRRAHTGEKPYQCESCEWRGVDSSSLIHHRKKHLNEDKRKTKSSNDAIKSKPTLNQEIMLENLDDLQLNEQNFQ